MTDSNQMYEAEYGEFVLAATGDSMIARPLSSFREERFTGLIDVQRGADAAFTNLEMQIHRYEPYPAAFPAAAFRLAPGKDKINTREDNQQDANAGRDGENQAWTVKKALRPLVAVSAVAPLAAFGASHFPGRGSVGFGELFLTGARRPDLAVIGYA